MKVLFLFFLTVFIAEIAGAEEGIKQITVNNYLNRRQHRQEKKGVRQITLLMNPVLIYCSMLTTRLTGMPGGMLLLKKRKKKTSRSFFL